MIEVRRPPRACGRRTPRATFAVLSALPSLLWCCGCGSDGAKLVPVAGVVTLDGRPLPGIEVSFDRPELSANENQAYVGLTDSNGHYTLHKGGGERSGVPPGEYRVSLTTVAPDPNSPPPKAQSTSIFGSEAPPPPERVPPAYRGKLKFTVPEQGTDKADFALVSK